MSDERIEIDVELRGADDASAELKDLSTDIDKVEDKSDVEITLKAQFDDAKRALKDLDSQIKGLADPVNIPDPDVDGKIAKVGEDTGKAKDAMHGFVGEAVTGLPGVGQALGPASEAVGQITEGLLAGEVAMSGLVAAAIPIAAIVVAVQAISSELDRQKAIDAFNDEQVKNFRDALEGVTDEAGAVVDKLRDMRKISFVDAGGEVEDVTANLKNLNLTVEDFGRLITDDAALARWKEQMLNANPALAELITSTDRYGVVQGNVVQEYGRTIPLGDDYARVLEAVTQGQKNVDKASQDAAVSNAVFGVKTDETTEKIKKQRTATDDLVTSIDILLGKYRTQDAFEDAQTSIDELGTTLADHGGDWLAVDAAADGARESILNAANTIRGDLSPALSNKITMLVDTGQLQAALTLLEQIDRLRRTVGFDPRLRNPVLGSPTPDNDTGGPRTVINNFPAGVSPTEVALASGVSTDRAGNLFGG